MLKKFFRRRVPDSLPYSLKINRIYIFPTKTGLIFLMMLVIMFLASLNSNNNLGFLLFFFLVSIFIVSILFTYKNLEGLRIISFGIEPVFAGEKASLNLLLETNKSQHENVYFVGTAPALESVRVKSLEVNQVQVAFETERRGVYELPDILIYSTYPMGLLRAWTYFRLPAELIIYPKPLSELPEYKFFTSSELAHGAEIKTGGRDDFSALREYVSGDPLSNVHWKALARGQGLFTKLFEGEAGGAYRFDLSLLSGDLEQRLSVLAGLIKQAEIARQAFSLHLPVVEIPVGTGLAHRNKCLNELARYSP